MTPQFALGSHLNGIRRSLGSCQFPDRKLANIVPVGEKNKKDEISNYRPDSLNSVSDKIVEEMILGINEKHLKDNSIIGHSQHEFMKGRSYLS